MTQTFDLNRMGVAPMSEFEMVEIVGGSFWSWVAAGLGSLVGIGLIVGSGGLVLGAAIGLLFMAGSAMNGVFE
jgi:hypothetical protein